MYICFKYLNNKYNFRCSCYFVRINMLKSLCSAGELARLHRWAGTSGSAGAPPSAETSHQTTPDWPGNSPADRTLLLILLRAPENIQTAQTQLNAQWSPLKSGKKLLKWLRVPKLIKLILMWQFLWHMHVGVTGVVSSLTVVTG